MSETEQATLPEIDATPADVTPEPVAPEVVAEAPKTMDDTIRETARKLGLTERPRGPDGKFAKAAPEPASEPQQAAPTDEPAESVAPEVKPEPKPWDAPPNTWSKEEAAEWAAMPEKARQAAHRREADFHKGLTEYKEAAGFGKSVFEDVAPHLDVMRQLGATPKEVVRDTLAAWRELVTGSPEQKRATLLQLANSYGINLSESSAPANAASALPPEIAPVLQRLQRLENTITESQRAQEQAKQAALLSEAEKFLSDPKHEHLDAVFDDVLALVRAGTSPEDAYNKAIWAHPETRAKLLAKQDAERKQREAAEAAAARKAAASNVQRRGTPPVLPKTGSMEDTIRATWRSLQS